jgi:hypothetical protein
LGDTVSFDFSALGIAPGSQSRFFFVKTDATSFKLGGSASITAVVSGISQSVTFPTFEPVSVPEPSTFALLGIGTVSLLGYGWQRMKRVV